MENVPVGAVKLCQLVCLRDMLRRGAVFHDLFFNEITGEVEYMRNDTRFFIKPNGDIEKNQEIPVTHYEVHRVYVSDRHEEKEMADRGRRIA